MVPIIRDTYCKYAVEWTVSGFQGAVQMDSFLSKLDSILSKSVKKLSKKISKIS